MPHGDRFTVSLDTELLAAFDLHLATQGYENRSEAIRDLIRDRLVEPRLHDDQSTVYASVMVLCDHGAARARDRLREVMHEAGDLVIGTLWHPADDTSDVMCLMLNGSPSGVQQIADRIQAVRGLRLGRVSLLPAKRDAAPSRR